MYSLLACTPLVGPCFAPLPSGVQRVSRVPAFWDETLGNLDEKREWRTTNVQPVANQDADAAVVRSDRKCPSNQAGGDSSHF